MFFFKFFKMFLNTIWRFKILSFSPSKTKGGSILSYEKSLFYFFPFLGHATQLVESLFPDPGLNPCPLQWKHSILLMGPPGSPSFSIFDSHLPEEPEKLASVLEKGCQAQVCPFHLLSFCKVESCPCVYPNLFFNKYLRQTRKRHRKIYC